MEERVKEDKQQKDGFILKIRTIIYQNIWLSFVDPKK